MNSIKRTYKKIERGDKGWIPYTTFVDVARKSNFSIDRIKGILTAQSNDLGRRN